MHSVFVMRMSWGQTWAVLSRIERIDRWGPVSTSHLATWKWKLVLLNNYHWKIIVTFIENSHKYKWPYFWVKLSCVCFMFA